MALVIVSGLACSGRTKRSQELVADFERRSGRDSMASSGLRVVHLRNKDVNIQQSQFATQTAEKPARAAYLSLVMRNLSKNTIVIADGGAGTNIKGFRYQLWCAAREIGVRCISVLCVSSPTVCMQRNQSRRLGNVGGSTCDDGEAYDEKTLEELLMRFEEPNPMTRWDSPLFVIDCNPPASSLTDTASESSDGWEQAPLDAIWEAITQGKLTKAPDVVAPSRGTTTNYLSQLESTTQLVLSAYQSLSSFAPLPETGGLVQLSITLPSAAASTVQLPLYLPIGKKAPTTAALQRLRRQFVKMHAAGAAAGNELGHALGQEGTSNPSPQAPNSRAERKGQQASRSGAKEATNVQPTSTEIDIAKRFIAYLEETL